MSDLIKKLQEMGYQFELGRDYEGATDFGVAVKDKTGKDIARTILRPTEEGIFTTHPYQQVFVDPEHRRQGVASAMYKFAEDQTGMKATPAETQNAMGKALWENPNRQFGEKKNKFPNITRRISQQELSDDQINQFIKEFEGLDEATKRSRRLGAGADAITYGIPDSDYVMKLPNKEREYNLSSLENNYLYSKQLGQHTPVEQPALVKRPGLDDVLIQRKIKTLDDIPESPSDEFYDSAYNSNPDAESRKAAVKLERKRIDNLTENKAYSDYLKQLDKDGILEGDIHRGNVGIDKTGTMRTFDVGKFWLDEDLSKTKMQNEGLSKMRETFSENMDKLKKSKIFRSVVGGLPYVGAAAALSSGEPAQAAEELAGDLPFVGQAYEAIKPDIAGSSFDDMQMKAESDAFKNYENSPARFNKLKGLLKK